jgi:hypothetical protein
VAAGGGSAPVLGATGLTLSSVDAFTVTEGQQIGYSCTSINTDRTTFAAAASISAIPVGNLSQNIA